MGTNYYLYEHDSFCSACGRRLEDAPPPLHIGKDSAGWCFALHVIPEEGLTSLAAWIDRWSSPDVTILDEYGRKVTPEEMERIVQQRSWDRSSAEDHTDAFLERNQAERGPGGLLRRRIGSHCVGHGEGPWDLVQGDFS